MKKNISYVLKEVLGEIKPTGLELKNINEYLRKFLAELERSKKKSKINAETFIGGSSAKETLIKKDHYDIDIFIRFDKKHLEENLSDLTEKILKGLKRTEKERIHGSRDYFKVKVKEGLFFEIIPVKEIKNQKEAENVTDLSYFHVNYIKKKLRGKILDEVRLAKAFCHANGCYGAESYIRGFSGYALELLIYHYGSFLKFIKAMKKVKDKLIIDIEKQYKNKNIILMDLNSAKLQSPIILIDPTQKQRNVLAALSEETFRKFQKSCSNFLRNPSIDFFRQKVANIEKIKADANNKGYEFILLKATTDRQEGDIAGSKLLKFYNHLTDEIKRYFEVKEKNFEYKDNKTAKFVFVVRRKKQILRQGPKINDKENLKRFKAKHKKTFNKNNRIYAKESINFNLRDFIARWKKSNADKIKDMFIVSFMFLEV